MSTNLKPCCDSSHSPRDAACKTYEVGETGRCVYCDHAKACHPGTGGECWVFDASADSTPPRPPRARARSQCPRCDKWVRSDEAHTCAAVPKGGTEAPDFENGVNLFETRRICDSATGGLWEVRGRDVYATQGDGLFSPVVRTPRPNRNGDDEQAEADRIFIAHARAALPNFCDAVEELRATLVSRNSRIEELEARFTAADADWCNRLALNYTIDFGELQDWAASMRDRISTGGRE